MLSFNSLYVLKKSENLCSGQAVSGIDISWCPLDHIERIIILQF